MEYENKELSGDLVDEEKLRKLKIRIFLMEKQNFISKKLKDNQMVDQIIKAINQEVKNDN